MIIVNYDISGGHILKNDIEYMVSKGSYTNTFELARKQPIEFPLISRVAKGFAILDSTAKSGVILIPFNKDYDGILEQYYYARELAKESRTPDYLLIEYIEENVTVTANYYTFEGYRVKFGDDSLSQGYAWQRILIRVLRSFKALKHSRLAGRYREFFNERGISEPVQKPKALPQIKWTGKSEEEIETLRSEQANFARKALKVKKEADAQMTPDELMAKYKDNMPSSFVKKIRKARVAFEKRRLGPEPKVYSDIEAYIDYHYPSYHILAYCARGVIGRKLRLSNTSQRFPYIVLSPCGRFWQANGGVMTEGKTMTSFKIQTYSYNPLDSNKDKNLRTQLAAQKWKDRVDKLTKSPITMEKLIEVFWNV